LISSTDYRLQASDQHCVNLTYGYIENITTSAILQISNGYRKIFQGSESTDLLEKSAISKDKKSRATADPALSR